MTWYKYTFSDLRLINYSKDDEMINVWIKRQVSTRRNSQNYQERVREWGSEGARCLTIWIIKISVRSFITNIFDNILRGCDLWYNLDSLNIECWMDLLRSKYSWNSGARYVCNQKYSIACWAPWAWHTIFGQTNKTLLVSKWLLHFIH